MASAPIRDHPRLSVELFRGFVEGRPEEERWGLIDGLPVMMAPPTKAHQRIASNLERLLNHVLEAQRLTLVAYREIGVNLAPSVDAALQSFRSLLRDFACTAPCGLSVGSLLQLPQ